MQELEDALERQNDDDDDADIRKVLQCFFSNLRSKLLTNDVIKTVCDVITLT